MRKSPRLRNDRREADCSADSLRQSSPGYSNVPASVLMGNRLSVTEGNRIGENLLDRMPQSLRFASPSMSLRSHCEAHGFAVIYTSLPRDVSPQRGFALRANFSRSLATARKTIIGVFLPEMNSGKRRNY